MTIKIQPMGDYQTNCYIVTINNKDLIIDPGIDATKWVLQNSNNAIAILNTHGHFDHVWSNAELKDKLNIPIYTPKDDAFMLKDDPFNNGTPPSVCDYLVDGDESLNIDGIDIKFIHYAGHTPGCSVIEIEDVIFSGDFIFSNSIGRVDFPYSNSQDMIKSINKFMQIKEDKIIYPGHGVSTTVFKEQQNAHKWLDYLQSRV